MPPSPRAAPPPPPPPPPRVRGAPPPPAPPPRARPPARPAQAAWVCFAARPPPPPPPPPRASRAHLCLAGPHSSLPSVECLSRWLLRTVWLFPLVTAFTFCLNSSPRSRPSPARRLPPPPAACAPAPPPAAGAPPLATWGPAPRSPPPPARRPSPAPSARRGYNCLSPPGGVILGVVGGGGGGEEGNFLVSPFPGGGSGVGGHGFQVSAGGRTPGLGRPRAWAGGAGGGGRGAPGRRGGDGRKWNMHFSTWPFGELGVWRGRGGKAFRVPHPPFLLSGFFEMLTCLPTPYPFLVPGDPHPYYVVVPENVHLGLLPPSTLLAFTPPFCVCVCVCAGGFQERICSKLNQGAIMRPTPL